MSKLSINLNTAPSSHRPSKNSRGIHFTSLPTTGNNSTQPYQPSTPKNTSLPRRVPTDNSPELDSALATPPSQGPVENFTPCVRKNDRFVDPSGNPLQPGTVIICNKLPVIVSNNSNNQINSINLQNPNNSNILGCLQSQILGLQSQALQHSTLNSIKIRNGNNKSKFTSWTQGGENAANLCNLDTLSIVLFKLQGPPRNWHAFWNHRKLM